MGRRWLGIAAVAAGGTAACLLVVYLYRRRRFNAVTDFIEIGTVSQLNLYPVKSMKAIPVDEMECRRIGGRNGQVCDREFMVMDADAGKLITGRQISKIVTIQAHVKDNCLVLHTDQAATTVNIDDVVKNHVVLKTELFEGLSQEGLDCGDDASRFLQKVLETDKNLRLIHHVEGLYSERDFIPKAKDILGVVTKRRDPIAYSDECPYHVICENSLRDLNSHLNGKCKMDMRRFRPVLQIEGPPAFDEDMWSELRVGDTTFTCFKPCTRCVMTTIDPDTGIRTTDNEPLKTLREYRLAPGRLRQVYKQSPMFGVYMGVNNPGGVIRVGDRVFARYKTHPH